MSDDQLIPTDFWSTGNDDDDNNEENEDDGDDADDEDYGTGPLDDMLTFDDLPSSMLNDRQLMPPPPPPPPPPTSQTTVSHVAATTAAQVPSPAKKPAVALDNSVRRLRVNDVHVELSPSVRATPIKQEGVSARPVVAPLTLDHYDVAKRLAADQRAAELAESHADGGGAMATSSKIGDTAAAVNHYLIAISNARAQLDPTILTQLPYTVQTTGAHIGRSFYMQALSTAPHLSRPVSEMTDLLRRLASEAKCVRREHIESMTRTPRLREEVCANREGCVAMSFCDYYNRPLPDRRPLVAFLFEDEWAQLRVARASLAAAWKQRACSA